MRLGGIQTATTISEFMVGFVDFKEKGGVVEPSTIRGYKSESKIINKYIGDIKLQELDIAMVNDWMAKMTAD
jgi:hypothetical protein